MTRRLTPEQAYELCKAVELSTLRRKRYVCPAHDGKAGLQLYRGIVWGITGRSIFQRRFGVDDTVIDWNNVETVTVETPKRPRKLLCIRGEGKEITIPITHDPGLLFFLNALSDACEKHSVDAEELAELREKWVYYGDVVKDLPLYFFLTLLLTLAGFFLVVGVSLAGTLFALKCILDGLDRLDPAPADPYFYLFLRFVPILVAAAVAFVVLFLGITRFLGKMTRWNANHSRKRFEKLKAILDADESGEYWNAYRERKNEEHSLEEFCEKRNAELQHASALAALYREKPRNIGFSARWAAFGWAGGPIFVLVYALLIGAPLVLVVVSGRLDGRIRDAFPDRWHDAGQGTVEKAEVIELKSDRGAKWVSRLTVKRTGSDGREYVVEDPRQIRSTGYSKGDSVAIEQYANREDVIRVKAKGINDDFLVMPKILAVTGGIFFSVFGVLSFLTRLPWKTFRNGDVAVGRVINPGGRHIAIRRGKRWENRRISSLGNRPFCRAVLLCPPNNPHWGFDVTNLPYRIKYDAETRTFHAPMVGFFTPVVILSLLLVLEAVIVALCFFTV